MNKLDIVVSASFGVLLGSLVAMWPAVAHAGERAVCSITMPTDQTPTSSDAQRLADGGVACRLGSVRSLAIQCDNPVYYSEKWDGGVDSLGQRGVVPATSSDMLIDFDVNPDPYRVDLRGGAQHISLRSVSTSANTCKIGTIQRHDP